MTAQRVNDFIEQFLPDIKPPDPRYLFTPHSLLYDFQGEYNHVLFTTPQLKDCLKAYLDMIDPMLEVITAEKDSVRELNVMHHDDASELLLAYFGRTPQDADPSDFVNYLIELYAIGQVSRLIEAVDPNGYNRAYDSVKRIYKVRDVLQRILDTHVPT